MVENVEVPMIRLDDGRMFIADTTVAQRPEVAKFVKRFSNYWHRDEKRCGWVSPLDGKPE